MNRRLFLFGIGAYASLRSGATARECHPSRALFQIVEVRREHGRLSAAAEVERERVAEAKRILADLLYRANAAPFLSFQRSEVMLAAYAIERPNDDASCRSRRFRLSFQIAAPCGWLGFLHDHPRFVPHEWRDYDRLGFRQGCSAI